MRFLFIKLKHIGDTLLLTPTLRAVKDTYPDSEIWVVVRIGCEGILSGCSAIDQIVTTVPPEKDKRNGNGVLSTIKLLRELRQQKFDYAFELGDGDRGRWLTVGSGAKMRSANLFHKFPVIWRPFFNRCVNINYFNCHRVEKDYRQVGECLNLPVEIPKLHFEKEKADFSFVTENKLKKFIVIHPATRWRRKQWPLDRWVEICNRLSKKSKQVVLSSGPNVDEIKFCRELLNKSSAEILFTGGNLSWAELAGVLYSARLFVGVDTAAMHLAAACQLPVVTLFGPSVEEFWRPWEVNHSIAIPDVAEKSYTLPSGYVDKTLRKMTDISVNQVWDLIETFFK